MRAQRRSRRATSALVRNRGLLRFVRAVAVLLVVLAALVALWMAIAPKPESGPGTIEGATRPARPPATDAASSILFGDLHVHTTYSIDAFIYSLPLFGGEGVHPPADACDFARHCSQLDFFSLNDHAEALPPERWRESLESVRACNARAGDPGDPDLVAFAGWEWTQTGVTPETHFGHRNVILRGDGDDEVPARPITALPQGNGEARQRHDGARRLRGVAAARTRALRRFPRADRGDRKPAGLRSRRRRPGAARRVSRERGVARRRSSRSCASGECRRS